MNSIIERHYPIFEMYQSLRDQLMAILDDDDLGFQVAGDRHLGEPTPLEAPISAQKRTHTPSSYRRFGW